MARTKGMLNLSGNLEVNAGAPLDARSVVPTVADLTIASNFQYKYIGMPVVVQATGDMYILTANDVTVAANWKQVGSGGGGSSYTAGDGIDITNNVISVDEMASADMAEIIDPVPGVGTHFHTYSEDDEQIVAYWIDGSPVYEITKQSHPKNVILIAITEGEIEYKIYQYIYPKVLTITHVDIFSKSNAQDVAIEYGGIADDTYDSIKLYQAVSGSYAEVNSTKYSYSIPNKTITLDKTAGFLVSIAPVGSSVPIKIEMYKNNVKVNEAVGAIKVIA